jgi:hypothetical protein
MFKSWETLYLVGTVVLLTSYMRNDSEKKVTIYVLSFQKD